MPGEERDLKARKCFSIGQCIIACKHICLFLQSKCHPQTIEVCRTRAEGLGLEAVVMDEGSFVYGKDVCGVLLQYPATDGTVDDYKGIVSKAHAANIKAGAGQTSRLTIP
jgi:glycine cleavage system pyridoxal-binding protein P